MILRKLFIALIIGLTPVLWWSQSQPTVADAAPIETVNSTIEQTYRPLAVETVTTTVVITASKDAFIISDTGADDNAGAEGGLAAGRTNVPDTRRALIAFDVVGSIPAGATIVEASMTIPVILSPTNGVNSTFSLHRVTTDWTEGTKTGNSGNTATTGEVTWNSAKHATTAWTTPGGDFNAMASSSTLITQLLGNYTWNSTPPMIADVQSWLDSASTNYGWVLKSDNETTPKTARLFGSIEEDSPAIPNNAPATLTVSYTFTPLPIPDQVLGTMGSDGWRVYNLTMMTGTTQFNDGVDTETKGYNGTFLGPVLVLTQTENITINVENKLGETSTTHWHGMHVPAEMDGGPHQQIADGDTWQAYFTVDNHASTNWFHPHLKGITGEHVYYGLAGLMYVNDTASEALAIPKTYGTDDIPLIIQDREFAGDGSLEYATATNRGFGDTFLVNGAINPVLDTHAQMIRFRILNGSNHRIYNYGFSDNRTFQQIASDGGFLTSSVPLTRLVLSPGERAEIVVDFSSDQGKALQFMAYNSEISHSNRDAFDSSDFSLFNILVGAPTTSPTPVTSLPSSLATITRFTADQAVNQSSPRKFDLDSTSTINGVSMDINRIDQVITLGDIELWEVTVSHGGSHNFHVHDEYFQVLSRDGVDPPANEMGWKDTVLVSPGETVLLLKHFEDFSDPDLPYMFHCHLLEHEDAGMMGQFIVVDDFLTPDNSSNSLANQTVTYNHTLSNPSMINSDTFTVTTSSSQGWTVTTNLSNPTVTLGAGGSQSIVISVTIPSNITAGTVETTTVTATSSNTTLMFQTATDVTTVIDGTIYVPIIVKSS